MHKLRLGDEVYTGPFYADRDDDICDGTGHMIHVQAVEGAETVAHALNVFAETVAAALTIDIDIKCHWCAELIDRVTVKKHATDEERLNEVVKCISDATWIESLDTPFCSADCYNASAEETRIVGGDDLWERE